MIDVQKSCFQVTKMLKMDIMKNSTNKYRTDVNFKTCICHVCTIECSF